MSTWEFCGATDIQTTMRAFTRTLTQHRVHPYRWWGDHQWRHDACLEKSKKAEAGWLDFLGTPASISSSLFLYQI